MRLSVDRKKLAAATLVCGAALAISPAADAFSENWYSRSAPLKATGDGQAAAYGTVYTKNGYVKNHTYYKDLAPGGNGVYTQTDYQYLVKKPSDGTVGWSLTFHQDQSARTTSSSWQDQYDSDDYTSRSQEGSVRVWYKVCEDQSMSPDACSRNPYIRVNGL